MPAAADGLGLWPPPGSVDICPDTLLRFRLQTGGMPRRVTIRTATGEPVVRIEPDGSGLARRTVGGALDDRGLPHLFRYRPFEADSTGDLLTVHPPFPLRASTRYRIEVPGLDRDWTFRTRDQLPPSAERLRVAADGSADFCTVQGAIDAAPTNPSGPVIISVAQGHYREICYITEDRPPMIIRGAGRGRTVISSDNNNRLNGAPSHSRSRLRRLGDRDLYNGWRAGVSVDAPDVTFEDLTLINSTPAGGSQAEAYRGNHDRLLLNRVELFGHQDTLRMQGLGFLTDCLISGTVDFVWGAGSAFHWRNEYRSRGPGYVLQVRNGAGEHGHVLRECRFTAGHGVPDAAVQIARTDSTAFPHSEVILIDCTLDRHIDPQGYLITGDPSAESVRFGEHGSLTPDGTVHDLARRHPGLRRLDPDEAARLRDPAEILRGWVPRTVNAESERSDPGGQIVINWSAPPGHDRHDLVQLGDIAVPVESSATLGALEITAPRRPGRYPIAFRSADRPNPGAAAVTSMIEVVDP
ncbi:MAG TPA: pectinesterase family protein [Microlunatus sp.]